MKSSCIDFVRLDFEGGLKDYRNAELGMDIAVPVAPSGIAPKRRECLAEKLNQVGRNVRFVLEGTAPSTIHIGKSNAFDAYGRFLGLAEGIGAGDAFVMLDDSASDAELLAVIRHEAGHILGTLDHGGTGLERYASHKVYGRPGEPLPEPDEWYAYYHSTHTRYITYANLSLQGIYREEIDLSCHDNETRISYGFVRRDKNDPNHSSEITSDSITSNNYLTATNCTAERISINGGTATNCSAYTISVWSSSDEDGDNLGSPDGRFFNYVFHQGVAANCTAHYLEVSDGALATGCEAAGIKVTSFNDYGGDEYHLQRGRVENCTIINGAKYDWTGRSYLDVKRGGIANNILVQFGVVEIGYALYEYTDSDYSIELENDFAEFGLCEASNLTVEDGNVYVYRGGSLHNATINGILYAEEGATLSGVITCKEVNISGMAPQDNITIKVDLHDYAVANYTEWLDDDFMTQIAYFADFTTKIYHYAYDSGGHKYLASVEDGTFDNKDGRFDMSDWKYSFNVDLGSVDEFVDVANRSGLRRHGKGLCRW